MESFTSAQVRCHARHTFNRMQRNGGTKNSRRNRKGIGKVDEGEDGKREAKNVDEKNPASAGFFFYNLLAERTGLEPATPGVTGRYSNQLNYRSTSFHQFVRLVGSTNLQRFSQPPMFWRPQGDSNPCTHRERVMS